MNQEILRRVDCRSCGSTDLVEVIDFGLQPLAGHFPRVAERDRACEKYPLDLTACTACGLLQVTWLPPIGDVFNEDYRYSSSTIPALVRYFSGYAAWLSERIPGGSRVLEFGCNDGVLLAQLAARGYSCVGVDASENVAFLARAKGLEVISGFFGERLVEEYRLRAAFELVTCSNVFAHIDDVIGCARAAWSALKNGGQFCVEVHDAGKLVEERQFDTIYHEHLSYYSDSTLACLLRRAGFTIKECVRTGMHGGGLRMRAEKAVSGQSDTRGRAEAPVIPYAEIGIALKDAIDEGRTSIDELFSKYGALAGFGAAGRSLMYVNVTKTGHAFSVVYDDSVLRQGRYLGGTNVQIKPYSDDTGGCCVILAWNYAPDIVKRLAGRFEKIITLLPRYTEWASS